MREKSFNFSDIFILYCISEWRGMSLIPFPCLQQLKYQSSEKTANGEIWEAVLWNPQSYIQQSLTTHNHCNIKQSLADAAMSYRCLRNLWLLRMAQNYIKFICWAPSDCQLHAMLGNTTILFTSLQLITWRVTSPLNMERKLAHCFILSWWTSQIQGILHIKMDTSSFHVNLKCSQIESSNVSNEYYQVKTQCLPK